MPVSLQSGIRLALWLVLLTAVGGAHAQSSSGKIEGSIADAQQAVLPQTIVELRDARGQILRKTFSDASGHFEFSTVPVGVYELHFFHDGFQRADKSAVRVGADSSSHVDVVLETGRVNQTIMVSAGQDALTTSNPTGSRLGLEPIHTPAAIAVVPNEVLQQRGYQQVEEAVRSMPGASSGGSPADPSQFIARGFVGNQVTLLRDGIYIGPANMVNRQQNSFNLESVELLQGPGSVLYGQGSVGGTVNVRTKKPSFDPFRWNSYTSYGSFNTYVLGIGGGGPLNHRLAYRSDFSFYGSDGYVEHSNPNNLNGTGSVLWKPRENLDLRLSLDVLRDRLSSYYGTPLVTGSFGSAPLHGVLETGDGTVLDSRMRFKNYNVSNAQLDSASYQPSLTVTWQPSAALSVSDQVYYYHAERMWANAETYTFLGASNGQVDANNNPIPDNVIARDRFHVFHNQNLPGNSFNTVWTHTLLHLNNKLSGGYEFYNISFVRRRGFPDAGYVDYVDPLHPEQGKYGTYAGDFPSRQSPTKVTDHAGYFEDALNLARNLILVTGIRFENFYLDRLNYRQNGSFQSSSSFSGTYHPINYRAGLVYSITPNLTAYGQFATAQDPPGNNIFLVNATTPAFKLSSSREGEVGLKSVFPRNLGEATLAVYDISRKKILTVNPVTSASDDNGSQSAKGFEFATVLHPVSLLNVNFNTAYVASKFGTFIDPNTGLNDAGKVPADVPATTSNLWASLSKVGSLPLELGGGLRFVGQRYADNANKTKLFHYSTFDLYGSYRVTEKLTFTVRGKNLFDKVFAQWADVNYPSEVVLGEPRSFTLSLNTRF